MRFHSTPLFSFGVTALLALGCHSKQDTTAPPPEEATPTAPAPAPMPEPTPPPAPPPAEASLTLTDGQIAAILSTANQTEIEAAKLAKSTSSNKDVVAFADMMITDHAKADEKATTLVRNIGVSPEESGVSGSIKAQAAKDTEHLTAMKGADFDRAYMEAQIDGHQAVLDLLDKQLIPQAKNVELKTLLSTIRPVVYAHLERARAITAKLP